MATKMAVRCRMAISRTRAMPKVANTFTQRGVLGVDRAPVLSAKNVND